MIIIVIIIMIILKLDLSRKVLQNLFTLLKINHNMILLKSCMLA